MNKEQSIVEQWNKTGLLSGLPEHAIEDCAFVLENQKMYKSNHGEFNKLSIPICRRIIERLHINPNFKSRLVESNRFDQWFDTQLKFGYSGEKSLNNDANYCGNLSHDIFSRINEHLNINEKIYRNKPFYFLGIGLKENSVVVFYS